MMRIDVEGLFSPERLTLTDGVDVAASKKLGIGRFLVWKKARQSHRALPTAAAAGWLED